MNRELNLIILCLAILSVIVGCTLISQRNVADLYAENVSTIVLVTNEAEGYGTGFVINKQKGLIISAYHLIDERQSIEDQRFRIKFQTDKLNKSGITLFGDIVAFDKSNDIIIIKVNSDKIKHLKISKLEFESKIFVGERVYCIGNPKNLFNITSFGIISSGFIFDENPLLPQPYMITDIHIIGGNSGCPVFDFENKIVGMVVRFYYSYSMIVPSTSIEKFIKENAN